MLRRDERASEPYCPSEEESVARAVSQLHPKDGHEHIATFRFVRSIEQGSAIGASPSFDRTVESIRKGIGAKGFDVINISIAPTEDARVALVIFTYK